MSTYALQSALYKALAHPTRLRILDIVAQQEACVCHLTTLLGQRQPYVSQHLMILREAGLVVDRREGVTVYYRLARLPILDILELARALLRKQGHDTTLPALPPSPLADCPCPHCSAAAGGVSLGKSVAPSSVALRRLGE